MSMVITIDNLTKKYAEAEVIHDLSVKISGGEFFTLLGPSGCGKTTLLRMIAGFASMESGTIAFDEIVVNNIPAHRRNIGMVFQNYAIFPHLTVRQNVEYGLKLRKLDKQEIKNRVDEMLELVQIADFQHRLPEHLSGGQQQRVALARAIVIHPNVLLMDEPLSNLDAKLRVEMRSVIREIHEKVGITTIYVTHDQEEALAISDRIAVMKDGVIQQIGTPEEIYTRPSNTFVATFIGQSNCVVGKLVPNGDGHALSLFDGHTIQLGNVANVQSECDVIAVIRPEEFIQADDGIRFKIKGKTFLGKYIIYDVAYANMPAIQYSQDVGQKTKTYNVGDVIKLKPNEEKINIYTSTGTENLISALSSS